MRASAPEAAKASLWRDRLKRRPGGRFRASIRTRVLAIVLIPSAALLITGATVAGVLVSDGISERTFAANLADAVDPFAQLENVVQAERAFSLRALGGDPQAIAGLRAQWNKTDLELSQVSGLADTLKELNPEAVGPAITSLGELAARMPAVRQSVELRQAAAADVDDFYSRFTRLAVVGLEGVARNSPEPQVASASITATDLFWVADTHSRAMGLAGGAVAQGALSPAERFTQGQLVGTYRNQLAAVVSRLTDSERARYEKLISSNAWRVATSGEDNLAQVGILNVPVSDWLTAEGQVSAELLGLWRDHFSYAQVVSTDAAETSLLRAIVAGVGVLLLAVAAFVVAIRLANGLVRRLRLLRTKTLELAEDKLPSMVRRLHDGEQVDVDSELAVVDNGHDEIGQVAEAFNTAQRTAFDAAAAEAKTRGGVNKVFLDIAHRSQIVVHRQLEVLDVAEAKQSDPEHLELLFQLDHLATRARRNAENLLILGGGQPGRKWRKPVALEEIVRSAISETEEFARVSAVRLPDVRLMGNVVADLVHLLAELVDNATSFSPPDAPVVVRGNVVGKGIVVEVEDQGLGIEFEERERLNETLRNPPDFQEVALAGHRNLGLFVIGQLAHRHGIAVSLLESAYGGIKAIALIPSRLIDADEGKAPAPGESEPPVPTLTGRHHQRANLRSEATEVPGPRLPVKDREETRQWPVEEPPTELPQGWAPFGNVDDQPPVAPQPQPTDRKRAPLPRRRRQSHLVPQLQLDNDQQQNGQAASSPRRLRSPDEARNSMSSFQRGTRQGRGTPGHENR